MIVISAPEYRRIIKNKWVPKNLIFVAGGITNCVDWQKDFIDKFKDFDDNVILLNPRRYDFDINNSNMSEEQIEWEFSYIQESNIMAFWFTEETLCPITLFELGNAIHEKLNLFVGCHPNYKRKFDVVKQMSLYREDVKVVFSLDELVNQVREHLTEY